MSQKILISENYDQFKFKYGNRDVSKRRVAAIARNIEENGWFCNPILVNEHMEIIDGQHRFTALKELGMPIEYVLIRGITLREARMLNSTSRNWGAQNYVDSYAADGNINYINFKLLEKKYPKLAMSALYGVVANRITVGGTAKLQDGTLSLPTDKLDELYSVFDFITDNYEDIKRIEGKISTVIAAIAWVLRNTPVDRKRLSQVLHKNVFPPVSESATKRFLEDLSREYNKRLRKDSQIKFDAIYELSK